MGEVGSGEFEEVGYFCIEELRMVGKVHVISGCMVEVGSDLRTSRAPSSV